MPWTSPRTEPAQLAVNICDLTRIDPTVRAMLLGGKLDVASGPIRTDPERLDESAIAFSCDLLTAACCLDVMRDHDRRAGDYPTRCYVKTASVWNKLPGRATLTVTITDKYLEHGKVVLNPEWFPHAVAPVVIKHSGPRRTF